MVGIPIIMSCMYVYTQIQYQIILIIKPTQMQVRPTNPFQILKHRFPHVDIQTLNPQLSFSQNLQNVIMQLGLPSSMFEVSYEISNMKEAVDCQELKIQRSLVNDQEVDINGWMAKRDHTASTRSSVNSTLLYQEQHYIHQKQTDNLQQYPNHQMIQEIWMLQSINPNADWFQH